MNKKFLLFSILIASVTVASEKNPNEPNTNAPEIKVEDPKINVGDNKNDNDKAKESNQSTGETNKPATDEKKSEDPKGGENKEKSDKKPDTEEPKKLEDGEKGKTPGQNNPNQDNPPKDPKKDLKDSGYWAKKFKNFGSWTAGFPLKVAQYFNFLTGPNIFKRQVAFVCASWAIIGAGSYVAWKKIKAAQQTKKEDQEFDDFMKSINEMANQYQRNENEEESAD